MALKMPRQVTKAPAYWKLPNNGKTVPGARVVGRLVKGCGGMHPHGVRDGLHNEVFGANWRSKIIGSTTDSALSRVEDESARKRWAQETQETAVVARKKYVRNVTLSLNAAKLKAVYESSYKRQTIPYATYYGARKKDNGSANISSLRFLFSNSATKLTFLPTHYNRHVNPKTNGKDPIKIEEGEAKFGWSGRYRDPFLREGPRTQPKRSIDNVTNIGDDGKFYRPNGVPDNLGRWVHQDLGRKEQVYDHLSHQLKGHNLFHTQVGSGGTRQKQLVKWYMDLLHTEVPRVLMPSPSIWKETRIRRVRHNDRLQEFDTFCRPPSEFFSNTPEFRTIGASLGSRRMERPDYC